MIPSLGHVVGNVNGNNTGNAWHILMKCADQPDPLSKKLGITEAGVVGPIDNVNAESIKAFLAVNPAYKATQQKEEGGPIYVNPPKK